MSSTLTKRQLQALGGVVTQTLVSGGRLGVGGGCVSAALTLSEMHVMRLRLRRMLAEAVHPIAPVGSP